MTTFKQLCIAGAASLTLLSGLVNPVLAQETLVNLMTGDNPVVEAFERSNTACVEAQEITSQVSSVYLLESMINGTYTVSDFALEMNQDPEKLIGHNARFWGDDITPNTVIEANKQFFYAESRFSS